MSHGPLRNHILRQKQVPMRATVQYSLSEHLPLAVLVRPCRFSLYNSPLLAWNLFCYYSVSGSLHETLKG